MKLEYLEDRDACPDRVLLLHEPTADEVVALRRAVRALVVGEAGVRTRIDEVPGVVPLEGCSLVLEVGEAGVGVEPIAGEASAFRCVLSPEGWLRVWNLLEPFAEPREGTGFQYLTEVGEIEWIVSIDRGW